jgi:hypothetical protein
VAARRLDVSIRFVNDRVRQKREAGALAPRRQDNCGRGTRTDVTDRAQRRIAVRPDPAPDEPTADVTTGHGLQGYRSPAGHLLLRLGLS